MRYLAKLTLLIIICATGCSTHQSKPQTEQLEVYNEALDQIISEYFISHCFLPADTASVNEIVRDLDNGRIDEYECQDQIKGIFEERKQKMPKCIVEYSPFFMVTIPEERAMFRSSISAEIRRLFAEQPEINISGAADLLLENSSFQWNSLSLPYIDFIKHDTTDQKTNHRYRYGKYGVGVITISKIWFSNDGAHAVVFFELKSSANYQRGDLLLLKKTWGRWKAVSFHEIWIA